MCLKIDIKVEKIIRVTIEIYTKLVLRAYYLYFPFRISQLLFKFRSHFDDLSFCELSCDLKIICRLCTYRHLYRNIFLPACTLYTELSKLLYIVMY